MHEFIIFATKGKSKREFPANARDIWNFPVDKLIAPSVRDHPSQKPVCLFERMIENSSAAGDVVMDCFIGSGTCAVAAINNHSVCICNSVNAVYAGLEDD